MLKIEKDLFFKHTKKKENECMNKRIYYILNTFKQLMHLTLYQ